jgi:hypothetical protein
MIARLLSAGLGPKCPLAARTKLKDSFALLGAAARAAYIKHGVVAARVPTANSTRTMSEVTE